MVAYFRWIYKNRIGHNIIFSWLNSILMFFFFKNPVCCGNHHLDRQYNSILVRLWFVSYRFRIRRHWLFTIHDCSQKKNQVQLEFLCTFRPTPTIPLTLLIKKNRRQQTESSNRAVDRQQIEKGNQNAQHCLKRDVWSYLRQSLLSGLHCGYLIYGYWF